eukprot:3932717-Rhodomonas_salina.2
MDIMHAERQGDSHSISTQFTDNTQVPESDGDFLSELEEESDHRSSMDTINSNATINMSLDSDSSSEDSIGNSREMHSFVGGEKEHDSEHMSFSQESEILANTQLTNITAHSIAMQNSSQYNKAAGRSGKLNNIPRAWVSQSCYIDNNIEKITIQQSECLFLFPFLITGTTMPKQAQSLLYLIACVRAMLLGDSKYVPELYLANVEGMKYCTSFLFDRQTLGHVNDIGEEENIPDLKVHIRISTCSVSGTNDASNDEKSIATVPFLVVSIITPTLFNLREAISMSIAGRKQMSEESRKIYQKRGALWCDIFQQNIFLKGASIFSDLKSTLDNINESGFTAMFSPEGACHSMQEYTTRHAQFTSIESCTISNLFSTSDFDVTCSLQSLIIWDKEWRILKDKELAARRAKKAKQSAAEKGSEEEQHIEEPTIDHPAIAYGDQTLEFVADDGLITYVGGCNGLHENLENEQLPPMLLRRIIAYALPAEIAEEALMRLREMENEDVATDSEVMEILKHGKNTRKNTMLCKQNLHQQKRIDNFIFSLPEVQRISISQHLLYANIEFVHALAAGDQGYKCPEVDIALHVLGREGHFAASKRYALDAKFRYLEDCKTFSRIAELNAAYMCPVTAAHLYLADCINKENKHNLLANPGNLHILALLLYNRPSAILDYNAKAIKGAKNGIGGCIWVCDGGGTYGAKVDGKHKVHVEKSNGVGADWIYNKYKQLVDAGKYAADTQKRATINTLSSISVMGLMLQCSDTYKADKLQSTCTGEIASRLAMTELAIGAKNDTSHQTAAALVHVIPRQTDDNAVKKYVTSAKGDADTRVNVTYDMLLYPALEICSSNNVNLLHAYERIYTVTRVMRMTASSSQIVEHSTNSRVPVIRGTTRGNSVHRMKNGVLASTRLCFVDIPSIASTIALTQREGFLGEQIRNSPISSTIWETFTSHMECNEGYLSEVAIDKETIPRHKDQAQTRAVSKSLMVIAATQMFRIAWPNALHGDGKTM